MVASDAKPDGFESELQVSVPKASAARLAATAQCAAAAGAGSAERRVVGVADRAAEGADAEVAEGEFVEIGFSQHDGAAASHAGGDARVEARLVVDQRARAAGSRHALKIDVVLVQHWHAVEGAAHAARGALGVAGAGIGEGVRVEGEDGVECRAASIVLSRAGEVLADKVFARDLPAGQRIFEL